MMILDLHRQGLSVTAIARRTGRDPKTIRKYIERGLELPAYGPRQVGRPNKITPYLDYVRERIAAFPELTATRLTRELRERGYTGAYTAVKRFVAAIRPSDGPRPFEVPPGDPCLWQAAERRGELRDVDIRRNKSGASNLCSHAVGQARHTISQRSR
jgi:transposase